MIKKYWYRYYEEWCPFCGRTNIFKTRVYDEPKPKDWNERHTHKEVYDYCNSL